MENKQETPLGELIAQLRKSARISGNEEYRSGLLYAIECAKTQKGKEKDFIINLVNNTTEKCTDLANNLVDKAFGVSMSFDHTGKEGEDFYSENFKQ